MIGPLDVVANRSAGGILHRDPLGLGPLPESGLLGLGESQRHGHDRNDISLIPPVTVRIPDLSVGSEREAVEVRLVGLETEALVQTVRSLT